MSEAGSNAEDAVTKMREELDGEESGLGGAMMGIADSYMELACGAGRGYGVHAHYRESNLHTGKPITELAVELAAWAAQIAAKAGALDAKRAHLKQLAEQATGDEKGSRHGPGGRPPRPAAAPSAGGTGVKARRRP
ncbi:hypothetical protein [Streptomyces sp. NPDC060027]|uniref:hypothetical protein n=1 Tax=Streptomyces sp. NPDC060027 TaxID=3347040 RepID=UPI0036A62588